MSDVLKPIIRTIFVCPKCSMEFETREEYDEHATLATRTKDGFLQEWAIGDVIMLEKGNEIVPKTIIGSAPDKVQGCQRVPVVLEYGALDRYDFFVVIPPNIIRWLLEPYNIE